MTTRIGLYLGIDYVDQTESGEVLRVLLDKNCFTNFILFKLHIPKQQLKNFYSSFVVLHTHYAIGVQFDALNSLSKLIFVILKKVIHFVYSISFKCHTLRHF